MRAVTFFVAGRGCCFVASAAAAESPCAPITLDQLPILPHGVSVQESSSHNKLRQNGDLNFSLYTDRQGDAVIFDAAGPGCVRSMWGTCLLKEIILKFYFDAEGQPRYTIPLMDFYRGKHPLFPTPLVSYERRGCGEAGFAGNCFVPIPFAKSLKISIQGPTKFYHILSDRYPYGTPVTTFTGKEDRRYLLDAFAKQGEELQPPADAKAIHTKTESLQPGGTLDILKVAKAGTVVQITIDGDGDERFLHQVEIEMRWDGAQRPDVKSPIGMFFGPAVRSENIRSLPMKVEKMPGGRMRFTTYFRMPFWRDGRITLVSRSDKPTGPIAADVSLAPSRYVESESGYFCALYRDGRTEMARDWLLYDAAGTGRFLGVVQTMHGEHYCEGNERFTLDGAGAPQINGTGSEDYYLACCWPNPNFNLPFAGCVGDIRQQPGPTCFYRFHLDAPIPFYSSLDARIQHGGRSDIVSQYRSLGFCYLRKRPALRQTDLVDVANEAGELMHRYQATSSKVTGELAAGNRN